jgi:hypothetical protein
MKREIMELQEKRRKIKHQELALAESILYDYVMMRKQRGNYPTPHTIKAGAYYVAQIRQDIARQEGMAQ